MSATNGTVEKPKRGRKSKDYIEIISKLKNIAKQDIGDFIRTPDKGDLNGLRLLSTKMLDISKEDPKHMPKEVRDCIKAMYYKDGFATIDLHDPLKATELLIQLGEIK